VESFHQGGVKTYGRVKHDVLDRTALEPLLVVLGEPMNRPALELDVVPDQDVDLLVRPASAAPSALIETRRYGR